MADMATALPKIGRRYEGGGKNYDYWYTQGAFILSIRRFVGVLFQKNGM